MLDIVLPTAEDLDTAGEMSGYAKSLYLIPATDSTPAEVTVAGAIGNGSPMPAFHNLWRYLGGYGENVVGHSVLGILKGKTAKLKELSDAYLGAEWNGNNDIGNWDEEGTSYWDRYELADSGYETYLDCGQWLAEDPCSFSGLCENIDVDPSDPKAVELVSAMIESEALSEGLYLSNINDAVESLQRDQEDG